MLGEFSHVFAFMILATIFVAAGLLMNKLLRPSNRNTLKLSSYECGEDPVGNSWLKFNIRFYVVALLFILFDVEILFLFPWAVVFKPMGVIAFVEMATFIVILAVGFAYAWVKGDLDWVRPAPSIPVLDEIRLQPKTTSLPLTKPVSVSEIHA